MSETLSQSSACVPAGKCLRSLPSTTFLPLFHCSYFQGPQTRCYVYFVRSPILTPMSQLHLRPYPAALCHSFSLGLRQERYTPWIARYLLLGPCQLLDSGVLDDIEGSTSSPSQVLLDGTSNDYIQARTWRDICYLALVSHLGHRTGGHYHTRLVRFFEHFPMVQLLRESTQQGPRNPLFCCCERLCAGIQVADVDV